MIYEIAGTYWQLQTYSFSDDMRSNTTHPRPELAREKGIVRARELALVGVTGGTLLAPSHIDHLGGEVFGRRQQVTGHKSRAMLARYYHSKASELALKLG